jgi:hypothetical protein
MKEHEFKNAFTYREQKFDSSAGYSAEKEIYYQCVLCRDVFSSLPEQSMCCSCGNLSIDVGGTTHKGDQTLRLLNAAAI